MPQERRSYESREPERESAPRPRPRRRRRKRGIGASLSFALLYVIFVIGVSALLACVGWIAANDVLALNKEAKTVTLTIKKEDTFDDVVDMLADNGLIEYKPLFKLFASFTHGKDKIAEFGTFTLDTDMDYRALISGMSANSAFRAEVTVTIPEGYTCAQIFRLLEEQGVSTVERLEDAAANHDYNFSFLKEIPLGDPNRLEGYLFPSTYQFYVNHDPVTALNKLLVAFDARFTDEKRAEVAGAGYTIREILTIASMIEKETDGTDRTRIASVIYNRLNNPGYETAGYLGIDATILYVTGGTEVDVNADTPYNTRTHQGLPPGPIANPGMESINAAMHPANEKYYYYALGDDNLHHYYQTYDGLSKFISTQERYK
ncbi:MAG: endolytic transglycosylase MltG [Lawsonibacter sp.]|nr:endolytic transglycosylase MltG [Lawsonibacter sp.]